jgi:hypothetical protein
MKEYLDMATTDQNFLRVIRLSIVEFNRHLYGGFVMQNSYSNVKFPITRGPLAQLSTLRTVLFELCKQLYNYTNSRI